MRYGKTRYLGAVIREMRRLNTKSPRKAMASLVRDIRNDLLGQLSKMNRSYKQETATRAEARLPIN